MEKFRSQPSTTFITTAIANMFTPLISTVMKANENAADRARALPIAQLQVSGHRVRLADVVEGHHHDAQEEHGGDGADPIPVRGQDAVLIRRSGPAHQLQRAEVGRNEAQARDPRGHLAAGHEELFAGVGLALQVEADPDHHHEVDRDNGDIEQAQMRERGRAKCEERARRMQAVQRLVETGTKPNIQSPTIG